MKASYPELKEMEKEVIPVKTARDQKMVTSDSGIPSESRHRSAVNRTDRKRGYRNFPVCSDGEKS